MSSAQASAADLLAGRFPKATKSEFRGQSRVIVPAEQAHEALQFLKTNGGFDLLVDITCVDYLNYRGAKDRFGLVPVSPAGVLRTCYMHLHGSYPRRR